MNLSAPQRQRLGDLDCQTIDLGSAPRFAVILCHGYGAPGDDLVSLAEAFAGLLDGDQPFRLVFPAAPLQPAELAAFAGRAWWEINMAALLAATDSDSFSEVHDTVPPGIEKATQQLLDCVTATLAGMGDRPRYALGGFSQGAMLTMNAALSGQLPAPELLLQFSGTLVCETAWRRGLQSGRLAETEVIQSHGRQDQVLPYSSAESLRDLVNGHCKRHDFLPFEGPHTIPLEAVAQAAVSLNRLAKR